ncbi:MAG TPA: hypothetical protein VGF86_13075 [Candidatus Tumulicola sp.]
MITTTRVESRVDGDALEVTVDLESTPRRLVYGTSEMFPLSEYAEAPHLTELFEFLLSFYAADRLAKRPLPRWRRDFLLNFPVRNVEAWLIAKPLLEQLIRQSTGDVVDIVLSERPRSSMHADSRQRPFHFQHEQLTSVALLSDGLDSFAGSFAPFAFPGERCAFVSLVTNTRKGDRIAKIARYLSERYPRRVLTHPIDLHLEDPPRRQEDSQRSRTMLAIGAGLTVAAAYGAKRLIVSEPGMGILNLPYHPLQMIHQSSQVLHPANLALWGDISDLLAGGARIVYPNRFKTKAQLIGEIPPDARHIIKVTSSCDAPQRFDANPDCGVCGSCIFRKIALHVVRLSRFDTTYTAKAPKGPDYDPADVFWRQAAGIRDALAQRDVWPALLRAQPTLRNSLIGPDPASKAQERIATIDLLTDHAIEMEVLRQLAYAI